MPHTESSVESVLAKHIATCRVEAIPLPALNAAKLSVVDTLAAMVAGRTANGIEEMVTLVRRWGGAPEARIPLTGISAPAPVAAWCNGAMARALEIDDCIDSLPIHPSAAVLPALFAAVDMVGGLTGKEFVRALVIAQDLKIRLGQAVTRNCMQSGRHNLFKIYGATAGVACAMRLTEEQILNALGIAASYAVGDGQCALDGSMALRVQFGNVAQGAIQATLLASRGVTGPSRFLTGRYGYLHAFEPEHDLRAITGGLGEEFRGSGISIKPYASCRATHTAACLAREARADLRAHGLDVNAIKGIDIHVAPEVDKLVGSPRDTKIRPATGPAAQFSLQFVVASVLLHDRMALQDSDSAALLDPERLSLASRVHVHPSEAQRTSNVVGRTTIAISLGDGTTMNLSSEVPWGSPLNPVDMEFLRQKLQNSISFSNLTCTTECADRLVTTVNGLEELKDTRILLDDFT